jgi:hypothetical protein
MIAHQDVRVDRAPPAAGSVGETLEIEPPIYVPEEAQRAVVAALDNMEWDSPDLNAR